MNVDKKILKILGKNDKMTTREIELKLNNVSLYRIRRLLRTMEKVGLVIGRDVYNRNMKEIEWRIR